MQTEADQILRTTLQAFDDGAIDEGGLSATDIVLQTVPCCCCLTAGAIGGISPQGARAAVTQLASIPAQN